MDRHKALVVGVARMVGLQPADADDVFQTTFMELANSLGRLRNPDRLDAWLATTARRAAVRLRRAERKRDRLFDGDAGSLDLVADDGIDERIDRLRMAERLRVEIERLGTPCSALLFGMFAATPRPYRDLARESGLAVGSLGATRARCLERLRRRLHVTAAAARNPERTP